MEHQASSALDRFNIEQHIISHNQFLRRSRFTLDDLNEYGLPLGSLVRAAYAASEDFITEEHAVTVLIQSIHQLRQIHAEMNRAEDAAQKSMRTSN